MDADEDLVEYHYNKLPTKESVWLRFVKKIKRSTNIKILPT